MFDLSYRYFKNLNKMSLKIRNQTCIIVCVGLPGAGKTTFCKKLAELWNEHYDIVHVSYDRLCNGNFSSGQRKEILEYVKNLLSLPNDAKRLILIDDNMYYKSMRSEYARLAKRYHVLFMQIFFDVRLNTALERNAIRDDSVPESIIKEMAEKLEVLEKDCYVISENFTFNSIEMGELQNAVEHRLNKPYDDETYREKIIIEKTMTEHGLMHKMDLALRKMVTEKIMVDKRNAKSFIDRRKDIFNGIKRKEIKIPNDLNEEDLYDFLIPLFDI